MIQEARLKIHGPRTDRDTAGLIRIESWERPARIKRALKTWGACWGIGLAALPFPILHFIILPIMLITGPFAALYVFTRESIVLGGEGECPECGKAFPIARLSNRFPQSDLCTHCQSSVKLYRA